MRPFLALVTPIGDYGPVDPGFGNPGGGGGGGGGSPPGIWPGPHPEHPWQPPTSQPPGIWPGPQPGHPWVPPTGTPPGIWPGPHPGQPWVPPTSQPPGMWPGPAPRPPVVLPGDPSWEGKPPPPVKPDAFTWSTAWTEQNGWVVVGVPSGVHPTPSAADKK